MNRRRIFLLLAMVLLFLTACEKTPSQTGSGIDLSGEKVNITSGNYVIVRAKEGTELEKDLAVDLRDKLSKVSGTSVRLNPDSRDEEAFEIIVGHADRPTATKAAEGLKENEYVISHKNGKLLILGGSDKALETAYDLFLKTFLDCDRTTADADLKTKTEVMVPVTIDYKNEYLTREQQLAQTRLISYPAFDETQIPRDYDYTVRVRQGENVIELPVYNAVYASDYFNNSAVNGDQHRRFCEFAFSGEPVTVEVTVNLDFSSYSVMPSSRQIPSECSVNVITYTLDKPQTTAIKVNGSSDTILTVFAEEPMLEEDIPNKNDPSVTYFEAGTHEIEGGVLEVTPGSTVYLEPGALVRARVIVGDRAKVIGRGAFIESSPTRMPIGDANYLCTLKSDTLLDGVKLLDAHTYNITTGGKNIRIQNVKVLSNQISTDGFSMWNGAGNITIENCYWHISDNVFVVESPDAGDLTVENCIVASDYAIFFPQHDIKSNSMIFRNIDVLRCGSFYKQNYNPNALDCKTNSILIENVFAVDTDPTKETRFLWLGNMGKGDKNITLRNVSAPACMKPEVDADAAAQDFHFTIDNVWVGDRQFTADSGFLLSWKSDKNNTVTFTEASDPSAVFVGKKNEVSVTPFTAPKVYVGGLRVETKTPPTQTHLPAYEVLCRLGFTVTEAENGALTAADGENTYTAEVNSDQYLENGRLMVPFAWIGKIVGQDVTFDAATNSVHVPNLMRKGNLLRNPGFEDGLSMAWVTRNFTQLYLSEDAHSGKYALRMARREETAENGIYQDVADIIKQYGAGTYRLSAWVKRVGDAGTQASVGITNGYWISTATTKATVALNGEWQEITYEYRVDDPEKPGLPTMFVGCVDGTNKQLLIDDISLEKVQ